MVLVGLGAQLNLFDRDLDLILFRLALLAPLLVLEFAVIHNTTNRRVGVRRNLYQIQADIVRSILRVPNAHDADVGIGMVNQSDVAHAANISVDPVR